MVPDDLFKKSPKFVEKSSLFDLTSKRESYFTQTWTRTIVMRDENIFMTNLVEGFLKNFRFTILEIPWLQ